MPRQLNRSPAFVYLALVPFITAALGFGIGGFSNYLNIPLWFAHAILMILLFKKISAQAPAGTAFEPWASVAFLLFLPWVFFTLFAGFGPPPANMQGWNDSALQQQVRYSILAAGGIISAVGFNRLAQQLSHSEGKRFAKAGRLAVFIAIPLYVLNMLYWGFFLTASFHYFIGHGITEKPEWYLSVRDLFYWLASIALALLYLSAALFAVSLKKAGVFKAGASNVYTAFSVFGFIFSLMPPSAPAPLDVIAYLVAVPAIFFILPYLMSINLATKGSLKEAKQDNDPQ
ncbi:MAG: hypothetical protein DI535_07245 [Citrobacter freundii]|nr:MAG: hypothetical protein DI535_07245 [Citrobacter freundii]